jgi:hypothetical protein
LETQRTEPVPFPLHEKGIFVECEVGRLRKEPREVRVECRLGEVFRAVGEAILDVSEEWEMFSIAAANLMNVNEEDAAFSKDTKRVLKRELRLLGLVEVEIDERSVSDRYIWKLPDYGREQLLLFRQ